MDFPTARFHWLGFPPGVLLGILLSTAQVVLQSLLFPDFAGYFLLPIILLYLLVPFFARLYTAVKADQTQNARNIGRQTGLTCAALAILTNVLLYISAGFLLGNTHFQGTGFSGFRLFFSIAAWFIGLVLLNLAGFVIALVGAWFGGLIGAMLTRHTQKTLWPEYVPQQHKRMGFWHYALFVPLLAALVGLQLLTETGLTQGLLPTLKALYAAPPAAFNPYNPTGISLSVLQNQLYEHVTPNAYILRTSDGSIMQKTSTDPFGSYQGILYTTYTSYPYRTIQATRESDGSKLWSYAVNKEIGSVQLVDGIIYFSLDASARPGMLGALDALNGHQLWQYTCSACYIAPPRISDGIVYISVWDNTTPPGRYIALRSGDGSLIWTVPQIPNASGDLGRYLIHGPIILQTSSTTLSAFNPANGRQLWQVMLPTGEQDYFISSQENSDLFLIVNQYGVSARSIESGALLWQQHKVASEGKIFLTSHNVYIMQSRQNAQNQACPCLTSLRTTDGQSLWQHNFGEPSPSTHFETFQVLGESQGLVFTQPFSQSSRTNTIFALHIADGSLAWQRSIPTPSPSTVVPAGGIDTMITVAPALLVGNVLYFAYQEIVTNAVPPGRVTLLVLSVVNVLLSRTTYTLATFALDAQNGSVVWQQRQVEAYQVL